MKIKNALNITAGLALLASAPLTRAQCPQSCDDSNAALGDRALEDNTGIENTAVGPHAGLLIQAANNNTAVGYEASGTAGGTGSFNTAVGSEALNSSEDNNTGLVTKRYIPAIQALVIQL